MTTRHLILVLAFVAFVGRVHGEDGTQPKIFLEHVCYYRKPLVAHITRSRPWQEGRRDVLDWGCGSGALALALAEKGAQQVVAVDLDPAAVKAANQRLLLFPNAFARQPRLGSRIIGVPGHVAYRNQFDIVVSYMGALTDGTTEQKKISANYAMDCAVRACRNGGSVVVAEFSLIDIYELLIDTLITSFAIFAPSLVVKKLNWWQISLFCFFLSIIGGNSMTAFGVRNIVRSTEMNKWRVSSLLWILYFSLHLRTSLQRIKQQVHESKARMDLMKSAGLTEVKATYRPCFWIYEALGTDKVSKMTSFIANLSVWPAVMVIYQGKKQGKEVEG